MEESHSKLDKSLSLSSEMAKINLKYYDLLAVTIKYNLARIFEVQYQFQEAENLYKVILKDYPNYIDCMRIIVLICILLNYYNVLLYVTGYLRLGCMDRDRNKIYDASCWFKRALKINVNHPDACLLLGNLYLSKMKWRIGQKKIKQALKVHM